MFGQVLECDLGDRRVAAQDPQHVAGAQAVGAAGVQVDLLGGHVADLGARRVRDARRVPGVRRRGGQQARHDGRQDSAAVRDAHQSPLGWHWKQAALW
jgi:hypothetical protein